MNPCDVDDAAMPLESLGPSLVWLMYMSMPGQIAVGVGPTDFVLGAVSQQSFSMNQARSEVDFADIGPRRPCRPLKVPGLYRCEICGRSVCGATRLASKGAPHMATLFRL